MDGDPRWCRNMNLNASIVQNCDWFGLINEIVKKAQRLSIFLQRQKLLGLACFSTFILLSSETSQSQSKIALPLQFSAF
jgi:hypothetical protein